MLVARIIIGGIFVYAGWEKISAMAETVGFFVSLGIPAFLAYVVGYAEFIGGILLILGLWTCVSSAVLAIIMAVAVCFTYKAGIAMFGFPLSLFAGLLYILATGAGHIVVPCKKWGANK